MADNDGGRPSFAAFWKRVKKHRGKGKDQEAEEMEEDDGAATAESQQQQQGSSSAAASPSRSAESQSPPSDTADQASKDKAKHRRAQVRKAQIQHRQRKANYVKQLELDISQLRDLITQEQHDTAELKRQNEGIRGALQTSGAERCCHSSISQPDSTYYSATASPGTFLGDLHGVDTQEWLAGQQLSDLDLNQRPQPQPQPLPLLSASELEMFGNINIDDITVSLSMNQLLGAPSFAVSSASSSTSVHSYAGPPSIFEAEPSSSTTPSLQTPLQEQTAINFILALEHVCWDHFAHTDFHNCNPNDSEEPSNHALMASTLCMNSAPESVYTARQQFDLSQAAHLSSSSSSTSPLPTFQWQAPGITLSTLYGLAQFHPDPTLVTPVQAWFELASLYPPAVLFAGGVLNALLFEMRILVRCVVFGAAMDRLAFESSIGRVLGSPPAGGLEAR